jgi:hypothetical protein
LLAPVVVLRLGLLVALVVLAPVRAALATTAADVPCAPSSPPPGPCVITTTLAVTAGSILDFGARGVTVTGAGGLDAGGGTMTIRAASLVLMPGSLLVSLGGEVDVTATGAIDVQAATNKGRIDVSGPSGGTIDLTAGGDVRIAGQLTADATAVLGDGGSIYIDGGTFALAASGNLTAAGGREAGGGDIEASAEVGGATLAGAIDVSALDGGYISVDATGDVTMSSTAVLNARSGAGGTSWEIDLTSWAAGVALAGTITAAAGGSLDLGDGTGGILDVEASTTISDDAAIDVTAGGTTGVAGEVDFDTDGDIVVTEAIDASASGSQAVGGTIDLEGGSGSFDARANLLANGAGAGGDISLFTYGTLRVSAAKIVADGPGAAIDFQGCAVNVTGTASVSSRGTNGDDRIFASGQMTIAGPLVAGHSNVLHYRDPAAPPVVLVSPVPAPIIELHPDLIACGAITTTTVPSTTTTSTRPTTTSRVSSTTTTPGSTTTTTVAPVAACAPSGCGDGDDCTEDRCDAAAGCVHDPLTGLDFVTCRIGGITTALADAPVAAVGGAARRGRYAASVARARRMVDAAGGASGRRRVGRLRRADRLLAAFMRAVATDAERGRIDRGLADRLIGLARAAESTLGPLAR